MAEGATYVAGAGERIANGQKRSRLRQSSRVVRNVLVVVRT
ncbi:hypothetical protein W823_13090 [Williamsia sp. D3]|nr:hypothetical protein W823_13090 [Williamsia sp. D3]